MQIQHPRVHLNRFDLVVTPRHDYYPLSPEAQEKIPRFLRSWITPREPPEKNVVCIIVVYGPFMRNYSFFLALKFLAPAVDFWIQVLTTGALHHIDFAALRSAASAWHDEFAPLPKPLVVVNIGGPTGNFLML